MGGKLSTLPEDEIIKAIEDPNSPGELNPEHVGFHRSSCLSENLAQGRTQLDNRPLDDDTKKETLFRYHPDSNLFCVYGKNKYGINGVLLNQQEEDQHRELWCKYNDCAAVPTEPASHYGVPERGTSSPSSNDASVMMMGIISSLSMFFIIMFMMIILLKKRRHNY